MLEQTSIARTTFEAVPKRIVVVSLLSCLMSLIVLFIAVDGRSGVLHQIMSIWCGPYVIACFCFFATFAIAHCLGFDMSWGRKQNDKSWIIFLLGFL